MPIWLWGEGKGIPSIYFPQKEFATRGYEVYFLCPIKEKEEKFLFSSGIRIYRFDFPFSFKKNIYIQTDSVFGRLKGTILSNLNWLFFQIHGFFWGIKLGIKVKPDIVYAHSFTSVFPAYLVSRMLRARLVVRVYGTRQLYWRWQSFWFRLKEFRDYLAFKFLADYFIITDDGNFGNLLAKKLGVPEEKIKYWRNGIDESFYEPQPNAKNAICKHLSIEPSYKIIVSTCRLIPDYRVDELIYALVSVFKKRNDVVCLIAGDGPQRNKLKEIVRNSGLSSRIFFLGIVDREMVRKILNAADIFVLLSRYHNCTNTMWEAMACGKCIVTTETEAIKEILSSGKNAVLVSPDNLKMIPKILEELLDNNDLRNELGKNARLRAQEVLESWSRRAEKEAYLLQELISSKSH